MIYKGAKAEGDCVIFSNNSFLKYSDREYGMIKIYSLQIDEQFPSEECIPKNTALKQKKDGFEGLRFKGHKKIQSNFKVNVYVSLFKKNLHFLCISWCQPLFNPFYPGNMYTFNE